jgi:hypothetical protein
MVCKDAGVNWGPRSGGKPAAYPPPGAAGSSLAYKPVTEAEIAAVVPEGSRWTRSQKKLLRAFLSQPELADLNSGGRTVAEIWRFLVRWAYQGQGTTMPVRARLCGELGIHASTWKRWRKWLEDRGWMATVRRGWTPRLMRASALADEEPNAAAIYVLCIPHQCSKNEPGRPLNHGAVKSEPLSRPPQVTPSSYGSSWAPQPRSRPPLKAALVPFAAALAPRPVKKISDKWCAWLARPWITAGWLPADLAHAADHHPVRGRYGWSWDAGLKPGPALAWRLSRWTTDPKAVFAAWRKNGAWPAGLTVAQPPSRRAWNGVKPVGQMYVDANRDRAAAAARASDDPGSRHAAALRQRHGWPEPKGRTT